MSITLQEFMLNEPSTFTLSHPSNIEVDPRSYMRLRKSGFISNNISYYDIHNSEFDFCKMSDRDIIQLLVLRPSYLELVVSIITASFIYDDYETIQSGHRLLPIMEAVCKKQFLSTKHYFFRHQTALRFMLRVSFSSAEENKIIQKCTRLLFRTYACDSSETTAIYNAHSLSNEIIEAGYHCSGDSFTWMSIVLSIDSNNSEVFLNSVDDKWNLRETRYAMGLFALLPIKDQLAPDVIDALCIQFSSVFSNNMFDVAEILIGLGKIDGDQTDAIFFRFNRYVNSYFKNKDENAIKAIKFCLEKLDVYNLMVDVLRVCEVSQSTFASIDDCSDDAKTVLCIIADIVKSSNEMICHAIGVIFQTSGAVELFIERCGISQESGELVIAQIKDIFRSSESRSNEKIRSGYYNDVVGCCTTDDYKMEKMRKEHSRDLAQTIAIIKRYLAKGELESTK